MLSVHLQLSVEQFLAAVKAVGPLLIAIGFHVHAKWKGRNDKRGPDDGPAL